ncbi:MAG: hypothetical protein A3F72_04385 [Bacteroidetes bacterium RIFCSPLOWO2_12_FULL_35_15]|nr:MAG: hypothetical protein A3F72_04385 [Bacteroidetes bacterium RIFCSPLOWO2_12_FULL_35_15]
MKLNLMIFTLFGISVLTLVSIYSCTNSSTASEQIFTETSPGVFEFKNQNYSKGIGPVKEIKLDPVDAVLAEKGKGIFETKCVACHKFDMKLIGPPLKGITSRRTPEWTMNMMLNPVEMTQTDTIAKSVFEVLKVQMVTQDLNQEDVRSVFEYLRQMDGVK